MRTIAHYFAEYVKQVNLTKFLSVALLMTLLITLNYTIGIEDRISDLTNRYTRFFAFFLLFTFVVATTYCILFVQTKLTPTAPSFYLLVLISTALFAVKMSMRAIPSTFEQYLSYPDFQYWVSVLHWPIKASLLTGTIFLLWKIFKFEKPVAGLSLPYGGLRPYYYLVLLMIPLLLFASSTSGFQQMYPRVQSIHRFENVADNTLLYSLIFELCYGIDFFTIELFFRGFMILAFVRYVGKDAILPMAAFYCAIHFGKPLAECISSFFGGMLLGSVVYYTRSIWGGVVVHLGIAWGMEVIGILDVGF